jgi:hypothetical protein
MRFVVVFIVLLAGLSLGQSPREMLLSSEGNQNILKLFREVPVPPIDDVDAESYRLTIIPTFFSPIVIRVEKHQDKVVLTAKRLSGQGGYDPGTLETELTRTLHSSAWNRLQDLLSKASFWDLPAFQDQFVPNEKNEITVCLDGASWTLEGVREGRYHVVSRYCPELKRFEAIGLYLVTLSGLDVREWELH